MRPLDKSPEAFRTISEVADILEVPQHVLRFWESKFSQLRPMKRGGGRRYYRPEDVDLLKGIRHLLYGEGYTIRGVQKILKEQGAKYVSQTALAGSGDEKPISVPDPVIEEQLDPVISKPTPKPKEPVSTPIVPAEHRNETPSQTTQSATSTLDKSDVKKLEDALFELSEIRRLLKESGQD